MRQIILLHGAIGAADQLQILSLKLSEKGFKVYSFSFSGHGKVPFQNSFGIERFSQELEKFISDNKLSQPHIFGYSMGGFVALYLASEQPDLLGTIVTLGTKFEWSPEIASKKIKMLDADTIQSKVPKFAEALRQRHGETWKDLLKKTAEMMVELGNNNVLTSDRIRSIKNKVVVGIADKDNMVSLDETVSVYHQLSNASMYMLPDSGHPIEKINTDVLLSVVQQACK
jgi:esterase/lipase